MGAIFLLGMLQNIINKFKDLWGAGAEDTVEGEIPPLPVSIKKTEIEGYLMSTNGDKSLVLVSMNNKCWQTKWFEDTAHTYKSPPLPISEIFMKRN